MSIRKILEQIMLYIPAVRNPKQHISLKNKLLWSLSVVALYFIMTNIPIYGLAEDGGQDAFGQFRSVLAGEQGSIMQLGIGPIVTASIVLQIMSGTNMLPLDLNDPRDQAFFQGLRRILILVMTVVSAIPIVFAGDFLIASTQTASALGISLTTLQIAMVAQITFGGFFIYYMDQIVSKWGVGSGVGLFIIAGVSQRLVGGVISDLIPSWWLIVTGEVSIPFSTEGIEMLILGTGSGGVGHILPLLTTVIIFSLVVYFESTRVEIPISNTRVKGANGRFPVKLIYASVLPIILVRAVQANIQFFGQILDSTFNAPNWLANYSQQGEPIGGLFYYLNPIHSPEEWMWWTGTATGEPTDIAIRVAVDLTWMIVGGALFAIFWVKSTGMDAGATGEKIYNSGLQIPGFRNDPKMVQRVLKRYIPYITVLGGALIGALAVAANLLGTIGGVDGAGLLLAVSITYKLYEEIAEEQMKEMNPLLRKFF